MSLDVDIMSSVIKRHPYNVAKINVRDYSFIGVKLMLYFIVPSKRRY